MTFEIEVGGRTRTVSVEAVTTVGLDGGLFRVRIDGVAHEVDARTTELGISLAHMDSGRSADVAITRNLRRIPLWIFHGEKDEVVSPDGSRAIAKALEKMKAPTKYTEFPGAGHGIGGQIFDDPEVHKWLFAQKRK